MSFWFPGRKRGGRRPLYSVSAPIVLIVMLTFLLTHAVWEAIRLLLDL